MTSELWKLLKEFDCESCKKYDQPFIFSVQLRRFDLEKLSTDRKLWTIDIQEVSKYFLSMPLNQAHLVFKLQLEEQIGKNIVCQ